MVRRARRWSHVHERLDAWRRVEVRVLCHWRKANRFAVRWAEGAGAAALAEVLARAKVDAAGGICRVVLARQLMEARHARREVLAKAGVGAVAAGKAIGDMAAPLFQQMTACPPRRGTRR